MRARFLPLLLASLAACTRERPSQPPQDMLVRISDDEAKGLDPQTVSDLASLRLAADEFEGLTRMNGHGVAEGGLADRWTHTPDGLRWRFHLRADLRFSDGRPIAAELFPLLLARLRARATASPSTALFEALARIDAPQPDVVQVTLRHPFPQLPELLAHPAMAAIPLHRIAAAGAGWTADRPIVASGAYQLVDWRLNDRKLLRANPAWHDGLAPVRWVEWRPVSDALAALRMFIAGEADTVTDVPASRIAWARARVGRALHVSPYRGSYYFVLNARRPPFSDPRVRQALTLTIERPAIAAALLAPGTKPAWGIVPPGVGGLPAFHPAWADWPLVRRVALARRLLRQAGYGPGHPLRFAIRFNSDPEHRRVALALAAGWRPLGVEAELLNSEASLHFASLRRGDFEAARAGWIGDVAAPENYLDVHRANAGPADYEGLSDPHFDATLDRAEAESDASQRARGMRAAETILVNDAAVLPVAFYVSRNLVARRVHGWFDNPANAHPSSTLRLAARGG